MEIIRGKQTSMIDRTTLTEILRGYDRVQIDLGTGDGRFTRHVAHAQSRTFVVGIDACRENLHEVSRRTPANTLFVIANAQALPVELGGLATGITINFPWGSLIEGLLRPDSAVLAGVVQIAQPRATLDLHLNAGALAEAGWALEAGADQIRAGLIRQGFAMQRPQPLTLPELKAFPTSWAKRLAFGRDPRALHLSGVRQNR